MTMEMCTILLALVYLGCAEVSAASLRPSEPFDHAVTLADDEYMLYWKYDKDKITFETRVRTTGSTGFGLSPNGRMDGADIVIAGVPQSGEPFFKDYFGNNIPQDSQQTWKLLNADVDGNFTVLKFARPLLSCDMKNVNITADTMTVMWSHSDTTDISQDSSRWGSRALQLLNYIPDTRLPSDVFSEDFIMSQVRTSTRMTSWCQEFPMPQLAGRYHIVGMEPLTPHGRGSVVNAMMLYSCDQSREDAQTRGSYECDSGPTGQMTSCTQLLAGWTAGSSDLRLPKDVGLPFGGDGVMSIYLQVHLRKLAQGRADYLSNIGLRLMLTSTMRKYEAGVLRAGVLPSRNHIIPPSPSFVSQGHCTQHCMEKILTERGDSGVRVFGGALIGQRFGRRMKTRHVRDGTEQREILKDYGYSYGATGLRLLEKPVRLTMNDNLITECTYDTTASDVSDIQQSDPLNPTVMCLSYLWYYPRVNATACMSIPTVEESLKVFNVTTRIANNAQGYEVVSPSEYAGQTLPSIARSAPWAEDNLQQRFQRAVLRGEVNSYCDQVPGAMTIEKTSVPVIRTPYVEAAGVCGGSGRDGPGPEPTENYPFSLVLEDPYTYILYWKHDGTSITFEVHVRTQGFVGFGISPNGGMVNSDVVMGGIKDGKPYFSDRFASRKWEPEVDASQDWRLLAASEVMNYTVLKFERPLRLCDPKDRNITADTVRVIWSYSESVPERLTSLPYHGARHRGARSVHLLSPTPRKALQDDAFPVDFVMDGLHLPSSDTTYYCRGFRAPRLDGKHHVIAISPALQKGHERLVHHVLLYACAQPIGDENHGVAYDCTTFANMPTDSCTTVIAAWAPGAGDFMFPDHVGLPIGDASVQFLRLEIHYDNPSMKSGLIDSSGLRLWVTPTLRQYDAGVVMTGLMAADLHIIPPGQENFTNHGFCTQDCLADAMGAGSSGVNIFAALLHTHLLGTAVSAMHFRGSQQLPNIATDDHYDFNFQEFRFLNKEVKVLPTDTIATECVYRSTGRASITTGGFPTTHEMCLSFLLYYPNIGLAQCLTAPAPRQSLSAFPNVKAMPSSVRPYYVITEPKDHVNKTLLDVARAADWTSPGLAAKFQSAVLEGPTVAFCKKSGDPPKITTPELQKLKKTYKEPQVPCHQQDGDESGRDHDSHEEDSHEDDSREDDSHERPMSEEKAEELPHKLVLLDPDVYVVRWGHDDNEITFETRVKTRGFIGFGISPNGDMVNSDLVIGGVKDNKTYFTDRFASARTEPAIDESQDWHLLEGREEQDVTVLKFSRRLRSCDSYDRNITDGTIRVIWSFSESDDVGYHGARRGSRSVHLIRPARYTTQRRERLLPDAYPIDIIMPNVTIPSVGTTYYCMGFRLPKMRGKQHIAMMEPMITPGTASFVHHIVAFLCDHIAEEHMGTAYNCYKNKAVVTDCSKYVFAWAVGAEKQWLPDHVGIPIGNEYGSLVLLELHYDNPGRKTGVVDGSGFRMWVTPTVRMYDANILMVGSGSGSQHIIPPFNKNFLSQGHCTRECMDKMLADQPEGITVFYVGLHGHLATRGVRARHFRNGVELPEIGKDDSYDFNYQEHRTPDNEIKLLQSDNLVVDCIYDTSKRNTITWGGLSTTDEMCLAFMMYYPAIETSYCLSVPTTKQITTALGSPSWNGTTDSFKIFVSSADWSNRTVQKRFQKAITEGPIYAFTGSHTKVSFNTTVDTPAVNVPYEPAEVPCDGEASMEDFPAQPTEYFPHSVVLKPDVYMLYWKYDKSTITFEVHVKTRGFIGLGVSPNGGMENADIVIGGISDGNIYFEDRHASKEEIPKVDDSQDWTLLRGSEDGEFTILTFSRPLRSCDPMDRNITEGTIRLIWAYSDTSVLQYHGNDRRGTQSVELLNPATVVPVLPKDAFPVDLLMKNVSVPSTDTTYYCRSFKVPNLGGKHHVVMFEPIIQAGHETLVHHMVVYSCHSPVDDAFDGEEFLCYESDNPTAECLTTFAEWAVGAAGYWFPEVMGLPIGDSSATFFRIEIHYDNPQMRRDFVDNSGLRLWVTPTLRQYDGGVLSVGVLVNSRHITPPFQEEFLTSGICYKDCLSEALGDKEIKVTAVSLHSHLLGAKMRLRHMRDDRELPPIYTDEHYDFNFQTYRAMRKEVVIKANDTLKIECVYDSRSRDDITEGGLSTRHEMCLAFIVYYPRIQLGVCGSMPTIAQSLTAFPEIKGKKILEYPGYDITGPSKYKGYSLTQVVRSMDWTNKTVSKRFETAVNTGGVRVACGYGMDQWYTPTWSVVEMPDFGDMPVVAQTPCKQSPPPTSAPPFSNFMVLAPRRAPGEPDAYTLSWTTDGVGVTFEARVRTRGYVGLGISPDGEMANSDVVTGGVHDGIPYLQDRYAFGEWEPEVDESQDWRLLSAHVKDDVTTLRFSRPFFSFDPRDINITEGEINLIWAYSAHPLVTRGATYHGETRRGTARVKLLPDRRTAAPSGAETKALVVSHSVGTQGRTADVCRVILNPQLDKGGDIVMVEPTVKEGKEMIRNISLFVCDSDIGKNVNIDTNFECESRKIFPGRCQRVFVAVNTGPEGFWYPATSAGIVPKHPNQDVYLLVAVSLHPQGRSGAALNAGLHIWMDSKPGKKPTSGAHIERPLVAVMVMSLILLITS